MTATGSRPSRWRSFAWTARAVQVRLRFFVALAVAFLVVGRWDTIRTYWDRWTAPASRDAMMGAVSADTEYFCPMDPGVLSDWPGKCPICHMTLVRRKKGEMGPLPSGVLARVQLSPERIQLAGIRTQSIGYQPLAKQIRLAGDVKTEEGLSFLVAEIGRDDARRIHPGLKVEVQPDPPDGSPPVLGNVSSTGTNDRAVISVPASMASSRFATAVISLPIAETEPFAAMPRGEPAIRSGDPRRTYACLDHPNEPKLQPGRCSKDNIILERVDLNANQRIDWWCPMHPKVTADVADRTCDECGGMILVPRVVTYCPAGQVLAVPESAVIDTGTRTLVYVESMPGVFDGVEVRVGPRSGAMYPVISGLQPGQSVAASGAFLVDAETRLNPSLAAGYFGANLRAETSPAKATKALDFSGLSPDDHASALAQSTCPITGKPLGSMGTPLRVEVKGRAVFLCCEGCEERLRADPDAYLAKIKTAAAHHP